MHHTRPLACLRCFHTSIIVGRLPPPADEACTHIDLRIVDQNGKESLPEVTTVVKEVDDDDSTADGAVGANPVTARIHVDSHAQKYRSEKFLSDYLIVISMVTTSSLASIKT